MSHHELERQAIAISPHKDDAAISIGHQLLPYQVVDVVNVCDVSDSHILPGIPDDVELVTAMRSNEDERMAALCGFTIHDGGFPDCEVRGVAWDDVLAPVDERLMVGVVDFLASTVRRARTNNGLPTDLYIPAAFGIHPDHYMTMLAALSDPVAEAAGDAARIFYADQPYYGQPQTMRHRLLDQLTHARRAASIFDIAVKRDILACYPSQLSPARVEMLLGQQAEYTWQADGLNLPENAPEQRYELTGNLFGSPAWLGHIAESYASPLRTFHYVGVTPEDGTLVDVPMVTDTHVVDGTMLKMARHAAAFGTDYLDYDGLGRHDAKSVSELRGALQIHGDDVLWLSNVREDSPLYTLLKDCPGELFEGVPSLSATCDPNGYDSWVSELSRNGKKKLARIHRKYAALDETLSADGMTPDVQIQPADEAAVSRFFALQSKRAESKDGLDVLANDPDYVNLMMGMGRTGQLSVAELRSGDQTISSVLLHLDSEHRHIYVLGQGFDPDYEAFEPSYAVLDRLMRFAHENRFQEVDFLRGDESYKRLFCDRLIKLYKYIEPLSDRAQSEWQQIEDYIKGYEE